MLAPLKVLDLNAKFGRYGKDGLAAVLSPNKCAGILESGEALSKLDSVGLGEAKLANLVNRFHATFPTDLDPWAESALGPNCPLAYPTSPGEAE